VFPTKYRQLVVDDAVDKLIRDIYLVIRKMYEIHFVRSIPAAFAGTTRGVR
jgi:hypothetical protein